MAKQSVSEEEIQFRKRARRRLVGAVALTILAAIFLPMIFDDQQKPVGNVQIQIPDEKTAPPFAPLPVSLPAAVSSPVAASSTEPVKPAPVKEPVKVLPEKPVQKAAKEKAESGQYMIQFGVFSNTANVRELRAKLSKIGVKTAAENVGDKKTRVRAGPYATRNEAEKIKKRISKSGIDGVVVVR